MKEEEILQLSLGVNVNNALTEKFFLKIINFYEMLVNHSLHPLTNSETKARSYVL